MPATAMQVDVRILRYNPERTPSPTGRTTGARPSRWTASSTLLHTIKWRAGRHAHLPPLLRPRRLRLRRHADQRPQPAGLQGPASTSSAATITVEPLPGLPVIKDLVVDMDGFFAKYRSVQPFLINDTPTSRARSGASRRRSGPATTTPPSASCAPPAPAPARRSGPSRATSARPPSSTPTASSSTRATRAPRSAWRSWPTRTACGAAARSSTARTPARAAST